MNTYTSYDTLRAYKVNHKLILNVAESLNDDQLNWRPADGHTNSIGFNLWHIARWADSLVADILEDMLELRADVGEPIEIWVRESLAEKWGLPAVLYPGGTGLGDDEAEGLIFPGKDEMLSYLRKAFAWTEELIVAFDKHYPVYEPVSDETLSKQLTDRRWNLSYYLMHHCRHLGMMEALKGLLTGKGSAAA